MVTLEKYPDVAPYSVDIKVDLEACVVQELVPDPEAESVNAEYSITAVPSVLVVKLP